MSIADGNPRPRWRGRVHLVGFLLAAPAGAALVWLAESSAARIALSIYALSLLALFGTSAGYHLLARTERAQRLMRRLDHSMIFVLVVGTYTPVCLLALPEGWGRPILAAVAVTGSCGVAIKLLGGPRLVRFSNALYIIMGWLAVLALPVILRHLSEIEFGLLLTGGVLYTIGAALFYLRRPRLRPHVFGYHEVWHVMTVLAALAHFAMVWSVAGRVDL